MVIENYSLEKFRKRYNDSKEFLIRLRDKDIEGQKAFDIVYYNGIKAFVVDNEKSQNNTVIIDLPENIYKLNRSNISNIVGPEKDVTKIDDLLDGIYDVRNKMKNYVNVHLSSINLKIGSAYYKGENYLQVQNNVLNILEKINKELEKHNLEINPQKIIDTIADKCAKTLDNFLVKHPELSLEIAKFATVYEKINYLFENYNDLVKKINFNVTVDSGLQINKSIEEDLKIEKIFILNTIFKDNLIYDKKSGFSKPEFKFKMLDEEKLNLENDLDKFDESIKLAIQNYEEKTGEELEKKYQHQFMLNTDVLTKFSNMGITNLIPFEEEYYINEGKDEEKNGRLDCIFIRPKEMEVYLIELKVNDSVIGTFGQKEHGIDEHIKDITNLCSNKEKLNKFLEILLKRFNNTQKKLYGQKYDFDLNKVKVHFYTIIAITPDIKDNAKKIVDKIKALYTAYDEKITLLNPEKERVIIEDCEMKILFDIWDKNINNEDFMSYKDVLEKILN